MATPGRGHHKLSWASLSNTRPAPAQQSFLLSAPLGLLWHCLLCWDPQASFPSGEPPKEARNPLIQASESGQGRGEPEYACIAKSESAARFFSPGSPSQASLLRSRSGERFPFLPAQLYRVSCPLLFPNRKNQPQGKAALWNLSLETLKVGDQNI